MAFPDHFYRSLIKIEAYSRGVKNVKDEFKSIANKAGNDIKELTVFAEASAYIYKHFTMSSDTINAKNFSLKINYKLKQGYITTTICDYTSNKHMYIAIFRCDKTA